MRTGQFARLLVLQSEVHKSFELCLRSPEKENIGEYLSLNRNLDDLLIILEMDTANTQKTDTYFRVIRNMQDYQQVQELADHRSKFRAYIHHI